MSAAQWAEMGVATGETLLMVLIASFFGYVIGLPLGVILNISSKGGLRPNKYINIPLGFLVNVTRSIPFLILAILCLPLSLLLLRTSLGWEAMSFCLSIASFPFIARLVEQSVQEVPLGEIEASKSLGLSTMQIIWHVILKESFPSLLRSGAIAVTTILSYSAMSGIMAGGGLGQIAINYGYYRTNYPIMIIAIVIIVVLTQAIQEFALWLARFLDKRAKS